MAGNMEVKKYKTFCGDSYCYYYYYYLVRQKLTFS